MICNEKGYSIEQFPLENKIVIGLPQTQATTNNTISPVSKTRKEALDHNGLSSLLLMAVYLFEGIKDDSIHYSN